MAEGATVAPDRVRLDSGRLWYSDAQLSPFPCALGGTVVGNPLPQFYRLRLIHGGRDDAANSGSLPTLI